MKGILRALVAAKLITLSPEDEMPAEIVSQTDENTISAEENVIPPINLTPEVVHNVFTSKLLDEESILNNKDFTILYGEANLVDSAYPAEKIIKLLDGLKEMDVATRKMAVMAMDAADDSWTVQDAVLDAQRKIAVLSNYQEHLNTLDVQAQKNAVLNIESVKKLQDENSSKILQQIKDLEALLTRESDKTVQKVTVLESEVAQISHNVKSEQQRIALEVSRLQVVLQYFDSSNQSPINS